MSRRFSSSPANPLGSSTRRSSSENWTRAAASRRRACRSASTPIGSKSAFGLARESVRAAANRGSTSPSTSSVERLVSSHERSMHDAAREIAHFGEERIAREDPVDEPEPRDLVGREELRQKEELLRLRGPDPPRELPGGTEVAAETDLRRRQPQEVDAVASSTCGGGLCGHAPRHVRRLGRGAQRSLLLASLGALGYHLPDGSCYSCVQAGVRARTKSSGVTRPSKTFTGTVRPESSSCQMRAS